MIRRMLVGSAVAAVTLLTPALAHADSTIVSRVGLPNPLQFQVVSGICSAASPTGTVTHLTGPGGPPVGGGSLQLEVGGKSAIALTDPLPSDAPDALTAFSFYSYIPTGSSTTYNATIVTTDGSGGLDVLTTPLPGSVGEWDPVDVLGSDLQWVDDPSGGGSTSLGHGDYLDFKGAHNDVTLVDVAISASSCTSTASHDLDIDDLAVEINAATTTYNFEAPIATALTSTLTSTSIVDGKGVRPSATLSAAGSHFAGRTVSLWSKPAGKSYALLAHAVTNSGGVATGPVQHPPTTTAYQWRFAADTTYAAAASKGSTVAVASKVTLKLAHSSVAKGKPIRATGTISPSRVGATVVLWRESGKRRIKISNAKLRHNGTYTMSKKLPPGHYAVFTTVAGDASNSTGTSPARKLTVR